jgi:probable HAF family extracellular repeat protein
MSRTVLSGLALLLAALAGLLPASPAAQTYAPAHLDSNGATSGGVAVDVDRSGRVAVGLATPAGGGWDQPARWNAHGTSFLPILPGASAGAAYAVNDAGTIVGESIEVVPQGHLLLLFSTGVAWIDDVPVTLASLATSGDTDIEPFWGTAIDDQGRIVGQGKRPEVVGLRGFVLRDGVLTDLGALNGLITGSTEPYDVNEQGVIVGASQAPDNFDHAFVWQAGVMSDLHVASGVAGRNSDARAVNEAGLIVGSADPTADLLDWQNAAMWEDGVLAYLPDLGDFGGVNESWARDVNDHGTIVGSAIEPGGGVRAVIWRDGDVVDLNALIPPASGWTLANAHAISNDGRIVGEGFTPGGIKPYVLVPDSDGGFEVYAAGCAGSGGFTPGLWGQGWPEGGGEIAFAVTNGPGGANGLLFVGLGQGSAPFLGCTLDVLPLTALHVPLALTAGGPGGGQWNLSLALPPSVPAGTLTLQAALADPAGPAGATVTNALRMDLAP